MYVCGGDPREMAERGNLKCNIKKMLYSFVKWNFSKRICLNDQCNAFESYNIVQCFASFFTFSRVGYLFVFFFRSFFTQNSYLDSYFNCFFIWPSWRDFGFVFVFGEIVAFLTHITHTHIRKILPSSCLDYVEFVHILMYLCVIIIIINKNAFHKTTRMYKYTRSLYPKYDISSWLATATLDPEHTGSWIMLYM